MNLNELIQPDHPIKLSDITGGEYEKDVLVIGTRAGPSDELSNAVHELAHFIEMESRRVGKPMWGMKTPGWEHIPGYNSFPKDYTKLLHVDRECRVWAIQYVLQNELFNIPVTVEELASSSPYLPSLWFLIGDDAKIIAHVSKKIKEELTNYPLQRIKKDYLHKVKLLKGYFKRKGTQHG